MHQNEVRNMVVQGLPNDPSNPISGQTYYNTSINALKVFNGTDWDVLFGDGVKSITGQAPIAATNLGGGTWRIEMPPASPSQDGYMSSEDKEKLDDATSSNVVDTLVLRDANGDCAARFITVQSPTQNNHAATKAYVDALLQGFNSPTEVRVHSENPVLRVGATAVIDGVNLAPGDLILLTNQTDKKENGVYVYNLTTWTRATGWQTGDEVSANLVIVKEGTDYADTFFLCTNNDSNDTVGTHDLTFSQFSGANDIQAGAALSKSGNRLDVNVDDSTIEVSSDALRVKNDGVTAAKLNDNVAGAALERSPVDKKLNVKVDTVTIRINALNQLEAVGGGGTGNVDRYQTTVSLSSTPTVITHNLGNRAVVVRCFESTSHEEIIPLIEYVDANTVRISSNPSVNAIVLVMG